MAAGRALLGTLRSRWHWLAPPLALVALVAAAWAWGREGSPALALLLVLQATLLLGVAVTGAHSLAVLRQVRRDDQQLRRLLAMSTKAARPVPSRRSADPRDSRDGVRVEVTAGHLLGGVGTAQLPVLLVVMIGTAPCDLDPVVREVAELQVLTASFRPVFVLDSPAFGPVRRYGYPAELVVDRAGWAHPSVTWEEYLVARMASIRSHFHSTGMIRVGAGGLDAVDRAVLSGGR